MRKISFHVDRVRTHIASGINRLHDTLLQDKKIKVQHGSVLALAVLAAPFAVHAMNSSAVPDTQIDEKPASIQAAPESSQAASDDSRDAGSAAGAAESSVNIEAESHSSGSTENEVNLKVNGQKVPVPKNGTVHKEVSDGGNKTVLDVRIKNDGQQNHYSSSSSTTVKIEQHSSSSGETTQEGGDGRHSNRR